MQGLVPRHFEFLITDEDRERTDSRVLATNLLLYSESLGCKGLRDIGNRQSNALWAGSRKATPWGAAGIGQFI
jgi:hypothetical protein